jgi:hypothetical protein
LNTYGYVLNNPLNFVDPKGLETFSIGFGGSFQQTAVGASMSGSVGIDTVGKVCFQFTTSGRFGPGGSVGAAVELAIGEGEFCEGNSVSGGIFGEGGLGPFGGLSVNASADGILGSASVKSGIGVGGAGGSQVCLTRTFCPFN